MRIAYCKSCGKQYIYVDTYFINEFIINNPDEISWLENWYVWAIQRNQWAFKTYSGDWDCIDAANKCVECN